MGPSVRAVPFESGGMMYKIWDANFSIELLYKKRMEATKYLSIINYSEWEKLCKSYSETHACNAIGKDGIFYFRLNDNSDKPLQSLDKILFAKRPDVKLIILPFQDPEKSNKYHAYTKQDFETLSQLTNVRKLGLSIAAQQSFTEFSRIELVTELYIYVDVRSDLRLVEKFPNINYLHLQGKFTEIVSLCGLKNLKGLSISDFQQIDFSVLHGISLKVLVVSDCQASENFPVLLSNGVEYLQLSGIKKVQNIDFISNATGLKKLYLDEFALTALPDFSKNKKLRVLQINAMHKLNEIETLISSNIEYLFVLLSADKVPAKVFSEVLAKIKTLKKAQMRLMDRHDKRYKIIKKQLENAGKSGLLAEDINFFETS